MQSLSHPHSPLARGPGSSNFYLYTHIPSYLRTPIPSSTRHPPPHTHKGMHRTKRSLYGLLPGALRALSLAAPRIWCFFPTSSHLGQGRAPGGVWPLGSVRDHQVERRAKPEIQPSLHRLSFMPGTVLWLTSKKGPRYQIWVHGHPRVPHAGK